jgi:flagellar motor switch protein FliM
MSERATPLSLVREQPRQDDAFPGIIKVGDRLARGLSSLIGHECNVVSEALQLETVGEWRAKQPGSIISAQIKLHPLKGELTFASSVAFMSHLVDLHYGGRGENIEDRTSTSIAENLSFDRLAERFTRSIIPAWNDILALEPVLVSSDNKSERNADSDQIAVQTFSVHIGEQTHRLACLYPLPLLRAVPQLLTHQSLSDCKDSGVDPVWQGKLADAIMNVRLPVRTIFARPELPLSKLISLAPGDFIPIRLPNHVPLTVAGRHFAHGSVGEDGGQAAVKIVRIEEGLCA